jgi:hypothetical protein
MTLPTLDMLTSTDDPVSHTREGDWLLLKQVPADHHETKSKLPLLVYRENGAFKASGRSWTIGRVMVQQYSGHGKTAKLLYKHRHREPEKVLLSELHCAAEVVGYVENGQLTLFPGA